MEKDMKTIFGIALLFTIITSIFYLLYDIAVGLKGTSFSWTVVAVAIIIILIMYNRRLNQGNNFIIGNEIIREGTGILILIYGLIGLPSILPNNILQMIIIYFQGSNISIPIMPTLIIIGMVILGIVLIRCNKKENKAMALNEEMKIIFGIALLFTIITSIFFLLANLVTIGLFLQNDANWSSYMNFLWIIVAGIIIVFLIRYNKKLDQNVKSILENKTIRKGTGLLVLIDGLISLSTNLPYSFTLMKAGVFYTVLPILILLGMICVGLILVRYNKKEVSII